ncbi:MAG: lipopolysaccharide biosynthesis protein [Pseudomonadota bacterium]
MSTVHSAIRWKVVDQVLTQGLNLLAAMILARLIAPAEFGLFAILVLLMVLGDVFAKGGLAMALVQRQDITHDDESTVFWFNLAVALLIAVGLFALAPAIAAFFEQERLTLLLRALVFNLVFAAGITVPWARLSKRLAFKRLALVTAISVGAGAVVAVLMALQGWGAGALVMQLLVSSGLNMLCLVVLERWQPAFTFDRRRFSTLFSYGAFHMGASLMMLLSRQAYTVFVGKLYSPADLGVFNRAVNTRGMPQNFIGSVYRGVGFPVLARLTPEPQRFRDSLRASLNAFMALALPVMAGIALVAEDLVPVMFGPNWSAVVPFLQVLCIGAIAWALNMINLNALSALGEARRVFRAQLMVQSLLLITVAITAQFNLLALAIGMSVMEFIGTAIFAGMLKRRLGYGLADQLRDLAPYLALLAAMAAAVSLQRALLPFDRALYGLVVSVVLGATVYLVPMVLLRLEAVDHGLMLLRKDPGSR